ncbi:MAG: hypothetical protein JO051_04755, partial [Acidobacteriaceae bacterium]|nr:hypothetical protein [Acidobacteriaceae bacterium]
MAQSTELSEWLTIADAAAALLTSERSITRRIKTGEIEARHRPRPGRKPLTVCNPADIERLQPPAHVMPDYSSNAALVPASERIPAGPTLHDVIAAMATAAAARPTPKQETRPWISLTEAAAATGLPKHFLRASALAG